eukprot:6153511-Amphidinium_carterae.1
MEIRVMGQHTRIATLWLWVQRIEDFMHESCDCDEDWASPQGTHHMGLSKGSCVFWFKGASEITKDFVCACLDISVKKFEVQPATLTVLLVMRQTLEGMQKFSGWRAPQDRARPMDSIVTPAWWSFW